MYILFALIAIFIVLLPINKKKATAYKNFMLDNALWIALLTFIVGVAINMADLDYLAFYDEVIDFFVVLMFASPFLIFRKIKKKFNEKILGKKQDIEKPLEEVKLPILADERKRIIKKFSDKYLLNLTDSEISKIANGSFQNVNWRNEIIAMTKEYNTISEWYNSDTDWVRAYLKAFSVQNVSSDFEYQKQMCIANFDEVFSKVDMKSFMSVDDCIKYINDRFYTNFDDVSFMIAYRFLEENGKKYELPKSGVIHMYSELDELEDKYRIKNNNMPN